jgi:hypothetical protein
VDHDHGLGLDLELELELELELVCISRCFPGPLTLYSCQCFRDFTIANAPDSTSLPYATRI